MTDCLFKGKRILCGLLLLTLLLISATTYSQLKNEIRGQVKDESGQLLASVTILAKNTSTNFTAGAQSDSMGIFKFTNLPTGGPYSFTVSSVGYEVQTLSGYTIKEGANITLLVKLKSDIKALTQVIVTGYSTQKKKDLTGAVSIINVDNAKSTPVAGIDQALQGRVAGVNVMSSNVPGGGVALRIRGLGTINSNDPLYIIDGIPVTGNINSFNPADFETIQVLKDASSASIYGARASNGVVIITTKTGKPGRSQVVYDGYVGVQKAIKLPELLDATEFGNAWFQALKNGGQTPPAGNPYGTGPQPVIPDYLNSASNLRSGNTNWFAEIFNPALVQSHTISMLNGDKNGRTAFNVGYYEQKGMIKYTGFKRYSARFNSDYTLFNKLKVGEFATVAYTESQSPSENQALGSTITSVYFADPLLPVYDSLGNFAGPPLRMPIGGRNPLASIYGNKDNYAKKWKILGKVFADLEIIKGLNARTNFAVDYTNFNSKNFNPSFSEGTQVNAVSSLSMFNSSLLTTTWSNTVNYKKSFNKHSIDALIGTEFILTSGQNLGGGRQSFPTNDVNGQQLNAGQLLFTNSSTGFKSSLWSQFGKINYDYDDKYLASFTVRNDATSKLAPGRNTQVFPAFSLGWRLSNENFLKSDKIDELKLRYGWGQTGNQEIADYAAFTTYALDLGTTYYDINGSNNAAVPGYSQQRIGNPLLKWETSTQSNIGLDYTGFANHFNLTVEYFIKKTNDLLVQPKIPSTFGVATPPYINGGSMENKGLEVEAGYRMSIAKDISFSIDGNFSYIKNKLTSLSEELAFIPSPVSNNLTRNLELQRSAIGLPIASFYGYNCLGIFKTQDEVNNHPSQTGKAIGRLKFEDTNKDGVVDDKDRIFLGSPLPTYNFGFNLKMDYKNFDFWAFIQGAGGNKIFDFTRVYSDFFTSPSLSNKNVRVLNAWSVDNPNSTIPSLTTVTTNNDTRPSSYFIKDADYLRFKTLQIGYTISSKFLGSKIAGKIRIYVQAQNLFTITKYDGLDPEVGLQNYGSDNRNLDMGVDRGLYPVARTYIFGVNMKL